MSIVPLPPAWVESIAGHPADGGPSGADWVAGLPGLVAAGLERWDLVVDGPPHTGRTAVVIPVRRGAEQLALKVVWPHAEGAHEALALRIWGGDGAVRLVAALPSDGLLLLERLDANLDLTGVWDAEACEVVGGLLARLHVHAPPQVPRLADQLAPHLARMAERPAVPRRIADRTRGLARDLLPEAPETLLHTDLHYENVLHSPDSGWTAVGPEPLAGHPGFEVWPVLRNRVGEMGIGASLRWSVRHRLAVVSEAAGIDPDEARAWTLLRAGLEVSRASTLEAGDSVTTCVALHKAIDD
ncbi:kinase [Phycicoccus sp. CSK15P-2]|uniref:aminoglycoside phosphotransferase family protein n=1 Tax=Phycicoccus sp. CSK15P-2 TaxID=2807627 RepID=UPI00195078C9|nr:aminoglycoside phosphotransferase family protein [Phycicoccus sp. CSK15P-2]MBM6404697.1 kinase [Phycicoccus sp. CSK15P-2]